MTFSEEQVSVILKAIYFDIENMRLGWAVRPEWLPREKQILQTVAAAIKNLPRD